MNILNLKNGLDVFDDEEETCVYRPEMEEKV